MEEGETQTNENVTKIYKVVFTKVRYPRGRHKKIHMVSEMGHESRTRKSDNTAGTVSIILSGLPIQSVTYLAIYVEPPEVRVQERFTCAPDKQKGVGSKTTATTSFVAIGLKAARTRSVTREQHG